MEELKVIKAKFSRAVACSSLSVLMASFAGAASAEWQFVGGEGSYYAFISDGGFVEGSYRNGMMLFCPDDGRNICDFRVWIDGQTPQPPVAVSFDFPSGRVITRLAEAPDGVSPVVGWEEDLQQALMSESQVTVSIDKGPSHTFTLDGSASAIGQAMNP
jgi:hypothetical protein